MLVSAVNVADLIKLHRFSGKVSYIAYPEFDEKRHPPLRLRVKVTLPTLGIDFFDFFDYSNWQDPPASASRWQMRLTESGHSVRGHQVVRVSK